MREASVETLTLRATGAATGTVLTTSLAAARVPVSAHPAQAPCMRATADSIQLYARVADRVEVATRLAAGRLIDLRA